MHEYGVVHGQKSQGCLQLCNIEPEFRLQWNYILYYHGQKWAYRWVNLLKDLQIGKQAANQSESYVRKSGFWWAKPRSLFVIPGFAD